MLPASRTNNPPAPSFMTGMVIAVVALMLFTLLTGLGLLSGTLQPSTGHLLMMLPCILMFLWYGYGYGKEPTNDGNLGLLLSLLGWGAAGVMMLVRFIAATRIEDVIATGVPQEQIFSDMTTAALVCGLIALACIVSGAYYSRQGANQV